MHYESLSEPSHMLELIYFPRILHPYINQLFLLETWHMMLEKILVLHRC